MFIEKETVGMNDQKIDSSEDDGLEHQREVMSTLALIKRVVYSLIMLALVLSVSFNLYLSYHNKRLNEAMDIYVGRVQQMSMRNQTLDRLFMDLVSLGHDNPGLQKLLNKYNIRPDQQGGGEEAPK
jgi:hypothetical protein